MDFNKFQIDAQEQKQLKIVGCDDEAWNEAIYSFPRFDVYDTAEYHRIASRGQDHVPQLFLFEKADYKIALPLVLRPIDVQSCGHQVWIDASSIYGYSGPLANTEDIPAEIKACFQDALTRNLRRLGVVSVFSRLSPFRPCESIITGMGEISDVGSTVVIDLTCSDEMRSAGYRRNHQDNIARLRAIRATTIYDQSFSCLEEFKSIYRQGMKQRNAKPYYYFDDRYFENIVSMLNKYTYLLINKINDETTCGVLFFSVGDIVHAHLATTHQKFRDLAPLKLLFDDAARFFSNRGCHALHIGGGVGGRADSLFHFKIGFSKSLRPFKVWQLIVNHAGYERLSCARGVEVAAAIEGHFPSYRCTDDLI